MVRVKFVLPGGAEADVEIGCNVAAMMAAVRNAIRGIDGGQS
jgi:hypothetical protein